MINFLFDKIDKVDSTNDCLLRELESGTLTKDKILIAREQMDGHGKDNSVFFSVKDKGIYFSFVHFYDELSDLDDLTRIAGVATYRAFKDIFDIKLNLKEVNDLLYNGKKVCGILCKNIISKKAVIIGVGIDLFENKDIDPSIRDIAGYIFKDKYELVDILNANKNLPHDTCVYKNIYDDFKYLKIEGIEINDQNLWDADHLVVQIVMNIYAMLNNKRIYEYSYMECKRS